MESAERLGYEVKVYARVPDLGDGMDRDRSVTRETLRHKRNSSGANGNMGTGAGSGSADSDPGPAQASSAQSSIVKPVNNGHSLGHSRSSSLNVPSSSNRAGAGAGGRGGSNIARVRYREQGVDELLQLKLHQAIADADTPPPLESTIVLATGDGNVGQFNADGFLGAVRTALRKGWRVELYAWEFGLSKAWAKEFGGGDETSETTPGPYGDKFKIVGLEKFAHDLLEMR
jgi:hypothetical protein